MRFLTLPWLLAKGPVLLCLLLLLFFSSHIAWQSYLWFSQKNQPTTFAQVDALRPSIDPKAIAGLFQGSIEGPVASQPSVTDLTLHGIFVHSDSAKSSALIAPNGGNTQRFNQGQTVADSTSIRAIHRDYVEIERQGRIEFLRFPKATLNYAVEEEQEAQEKRIRMMEALREQMEAAHAQHDDPTLTNMAMDSE